MVTWRLSLDNPLYKCTYKSSLIHRHFPDLSLFEQTRQKEHVVMYLLKSGLLSFIFCWRGGREGHVGKEDSYISKQKWKFINNKVEKSIEGCIAPRRLEHVRRQAPDMEQDSSLPSIENQPFIFQGTRQLLRLMNRKLFSAVWGWSKNAAKGMTVLRTRAVI